MRWGWNAAVGGWLRKREGWGWAGALGRLDWVEMGQSTGSGSPRPLLPTHSPHMLSLLSPGNRAHFVYGIACDHGCIWDLKFCPSGAWELPGTPRKVPPCWLWDALGLRVRTERPCEFSEGTESGGWSFPGNPISFPGAKTSKVF